MNEGNTGGIPEFRFSSEKNDSQSAVTNSSNTTGTGKALSNTSSVITDKTSVFQKITAFLKIVKFDAMFFVKLFDRYIAWTRKILTPELFETISAWFIKLGHVMLVLISAFSLLFWVVAAIKESKGMYLLFGIGYSLLFLVLQYTAHKFLNAGKALVLASQSRLASAAFLDCLALLSEIAGITIFIRYLAYEQWNYFWIGLGLWFICDLIAYVALNPSMANVIIADDAAPGEEAIGIISFFIKAFMRIVPIAFGTGITLGFLSLLGGTFALIKSGGNEFAGQSSLDHAILYACLPFISYAIFTIYHLTIDILRAILVIPGKLDKIMNKSGE
ncbi:MAG: hypothetical protein PHR77_19770 [Kiritimatiellae bacterium]|nr:hypothetical protein [Kiritimatiellia bacterium]MDD5523190.1 hypothetical protein [Kiritimatiellia bacterium]